MGKGSWVQRSRIPKLGKDLWLLPSDVLSAHIHIRDHRGAGPGQAAEQAGVKVVGGGHSPSDIACTDGFLIHMGKMNRVLQVDTEKKQVTMEAGIHLSDLHPQLDKHGLALSNLGAMSDVTAGGVIGTGTHNTGIKHSILATQVVALTLLTADGTILECSESSNAEVLQAVRVRLGCLGVILTITLQCVPQFHLQETSFPSTLREVLDNLDSHLKKSEYFCFLWSPHTENVSFIYQDHTNMEATLSHSPQSPYPFSYTAADACRHPGASWFGDYAIGFHLLEFLLWIRPYGKDVSRLDYWLAYQTIMKKVRGRPHWAKFCAIREKLDPTGMFLNAYLEVFY